ncbi:MAG: cobalamin biosynthesis protein CbiA [Desulfobacterales bacterium]|nr:cobalamin biosynthesis protein CbiA [Desulfobacterales bacterium]
MGLNLEGIVVFVGNYGSGKTEVAINFAVNRKQSGVDVRIADLDVINPYFRTREAVDALSGIGIEVVVPPKEYLQADLPVVNPSVLGMIRRPGQLTLIDAGGNDAGVAVLASIIGHIKGKPVQMIQVVNPFRPLTTDIDGCLKMKAEIEKTATITINSLIGNANLMELTTCADIYSGYDFMQNLSREGKMKLEFITAPSNIFPEIDRERIACPVLPIRRQMVPPWKEREKFQSI